MFGSTAKEGKVVASSLTESALEEPRVLERWKKHGVHTTMRDEKAFVPWMWKKDSCHLKELQRKQGHQGETVSS